MVRIAFMSRTPVQVFKGPDQRFDMGGAIKLHTPYAAKVNSFAIWQRCALVCFVIAGSPNIDINVFEVGADTTCGFRKMGSDTSDGRVAHVCGVWLAFQVAEPNSASTGLGTDALYPRRGAGIPGMDP